MAGITTFSFKLFNCHDAHATPSSFYLFPSFASKLFGLLLSNPHYFSLHLSCLRNRPLRLQLRRRRRSPPAIPTPGGPSPIPTMAKLSTSLLSDSVRLIDQNQNMAGVVSIDDAIQMAEDVELGLVILFSDADPPVIRIMNYSKYRYKQQKKKRGQQKKSAANRMDLKELKLGYNIDEHDYIVRLKAARKFLKDGDKVKVIVNLKGRENDFRNLAIQLIKRFRSDVGELGDDESKNFRERNIYIILVPNKAAVQKT